METPTTRDDTQVLPTVSPGPLVTIDSVPRTIRMYQVSDPEMDVFTSSYNSIHATFFGLAVGAAITLGISLITIDTLSDRMFATFAALFAVSVIGAIYFGLRWRSDQDKAAKQADSIRERRV